MAVKKKVVEIETQQAETSVKELRKELKKLKDQMLSSEQGTVEYSQALQRAADIQHQLKEQMEEVNASAMDFGQIASNVVKATGGVVAGFQAAQATMNLFGAENEEVMKAMEKMQNLMAITQALPGLDEGMKAFGRLTDRILAATTATVAKTTATETDTTATVVNAAAQKSVATATKGATIATNGFKKALIATGLGAIVVVLGSIIANWDEFTKAIGLSEETLQKLGDVWGGVQNVLIKGVKGVGIAIVRYIGFIKDAYVNVFSGLADAIKSLFSGDFSGVKDAIKGIGNDFVASFEKATDGLGDYFNVTANYAEGVQKAHLKKQEKAVDNYNKNIKTKAKTRTETIKKEAKTQEQIEKERLAAANEALDIELEKVKRNGLAKKDELKSQIDIEKRRLKLLNKGTIEYEKQLTKILNLEKELENLNNEVDPEVKAEEERIAALQKELNDLQKSYRSKLQIIADNEANELAIINQSHEDKLVSDEEYARLKTEIEQKYSDQRQKIADEEAAKEEARHTELVNNAVATASAASSLLTNVLDSIAESQDISNKEGFERQKKLQIASATIQMLTGIATAFTGAYTTKSGPWDFALMGIQAATIAAAGVANIAKIKQQQFEGGSSTGASASPNTSAITSIHTPVQYTQDVQGASIEGAVKDTKVYVTESDISNTQNKVEVAESEARF